MAFNMLFFYLCISLRAFEGKHVKMKLVSHALRTQEHLAMATMTNTFL